MPPDVDPTPEGKIAMTATDTGRRGDWTQTFTGRAFWPLDPRPDDIDPADIAHALGHLCRYNGATRIHYSVAEHCVLLSHAVSGGNALWALLHDAAEAYVGDMVRPLRRSMPAFCAVEEAILDVVCGRFGLSRGMPGEVCDADGRILLDERAALLSAPPRSWGPVEQLTPLGVTIEGWPAAEAERRYLARLRELADLDGPPAA